LQKYVAAERAAEPTPGTAAYDLKASARQIAAHCARYRGAITGKAVAQIVTTALPFLAVVAVMFWLVQQAYWATLLLAFPAAGLLLRFFIIQHDCGHGSFLPTRLANDLVGRAMSVLTLTPYGLWRREHAIHHAGSGNLERRGIGDIETMTVEEYLTKSWIERLRYRIYRHPIFLFIFGVPFYFIVLQRLPWFHGLEARDAWKSVVGLNAVVVAIYGTLAYLLGIGTFAMVFLPIVVIAAATGGWLFFIQHQFEETHWEEPDNWDFQVAAIHGSSYYALPRVLQWFTGNIGLHHIHHLNSMIPNYRLQECMDALPELASINRLTVLESLKCVRLTLWDSHARRLIGFDDIHPRAA
jgi:omega-6 fatty acid desaturase (delta-12 desaturase)